MVNGEGDRRRSDNGMKLIKAGMLGIQNMDSNSDKQKAPEGAIISD